MSDCERYRGLIERLIEGEEPAERAALDRHLASCPECAGLLELHRRLDGLEASLSDLGEPDEPGEAELAAVRRAVLRSIRSEQSARERAGTRFWSRLPGSGGDRRAEPRWQWAAAAVVLVLLSGTAGLAIGRTLAPVMSRTGSALVDGGGQDPLLRTLERTALRHTGLSDVERSPYSFTNVQVRTVAPDRLALSFDVSTHLELERPRHDPLVTEVLVQSLVDGGSSLGTQLKAISATAGVPEPRLLEALVQTMLHDPNQAVRLAATERLASYPAEPKIEAAFLTVLEQEESVQMRLIAIDHLTERAVAPDALERAIRSGPQPGSALQVRASDYLRRF